MNNQQKVANLISALDCLFGAADCLDQAKEVESAEQVRVLFTQVSKQLTNVSNGG